MKLFRVRPHRDPSPRPGRQVLVSGTLAGVLSGAFLAWLGRSEGAGAAAPINAVSHAVWGREALWRDDTTAKYTLTGAAIHGVSALFWAVFYGLMRQGRRRPDAANAVTDALALTVVAAIVDLKCVPSRLTPGFEQRLSDRGLALVYLGLAAGLALGGVLTLRQITKR